MPTLERMYTVLHTTQDTSFFDDTENEESIWDE